MHALLNGRAAIDRRINGRCNGPLLNGKTSPVPPPVGSVLLTEAGGYLLQEDGGRLLLEQDVRVGPGLLTEEGGRLLKEDGGRLLVETATYLLKEDGGQLLQEGGGRLTIEISAAGRPVGLFPYIFTRKS